MYATVYTANYHLISSGRPVALHWITLYQFYWVFKWPMEIVTFENRRRQLPGATSGVIPGVLVLAGFLLYQLDEFLGLTMTFSTGIKLSQRMRNARLAPPVPKTRHASATAGPLG